MKTLAILAALAVIHADHPGPKIDRHVYGQFAEHLGRGIYEGLWVGEASPIANTHGFRNDVIAALRELHVPDVRWPGGCFADEYHWRDGIGPREKRPVTLNTNWGGVPETNAFGTHEFMELTEMIGAEAYINANLGTGSTREMAEWLQYLTSDKPTALTAERARNGHPGPWKVAYFAIGNESWGCGGNMTPDDYIALYRPAVTFLKAPEGARPVMIASGGHDDDTSWTQALAARHPYGLEVISYHYYTIPGPRWEDKGASTGFPEAQWIPTVAHALQMQDHIQRNSAILDQYDPGKTIALAVDEWGTWYDPEPGRQPGFLYQQNTLRDAVVAATTLNIFHQHADRVRMANIAQMVNVLQAMILTQGPKMVLTPTYHVFRLFRPFQDATSLPVDLTTPNYGAIPAVSMSAARAPDGTLLLALVNQDPKDVIATTVSIDGLRPKHVQGDILTATAMDARNTFETPDAIHPQAFSQVSVEGGKLSLALPAKAVVVLRIQ